METQTHISRVRQIPDDYQLVSDSQDIRTALESIGQLERLNDTGCLFVRIGEGEYTDVFQCVTCVPWLDAIVVRLNLTRCQHQAQSPPAYVTHASTN